MILRFILAHTVTVLLYEKEPKHRPRSSGIGMKVSGHAPQGWLK